MSRPIPLRHRSQSMAVRFCTAALMALAMIIPMDALSAPQARAAGEGEVIASPFNATIGQTIQVRRGGYNSTNDQGYGYAKICLKHNLCTADGLRWIYQSSNVTNQGSYKQLRAYVGKYVNGRLIEQIEILAIYNPNRYDTYYGYQVGGGRLGAMTAYCIGYVQCPAWAGATAASKYKPSGAGSATTTQQQTPEGTVTYDRGYAPLVG